MTYTPTEKFSPSGLSKARDCKRAYALRYLTGEKEPEVTWAEACALVKPTQPKKATKQQLQVFRAELKAYNKVYRPALGKEIHSRLEAYYKGEAVDFEDAPGRIALVMLQHLPPPASCTAIETEGSITIAPDVAGDIEFRGSRDLCVCVDGVWRLIDYKTTYTFDYIDWEKTVKTVKTPEQLEQDEQANIYALDVMQRHNLQLLACRWVYGRTEGDPASAAVDFTITRASAEKRVRELAVLATELRGYMREKVDPMSVEATPTSCGKFGGCIYHTDKGGPCVPPKENAAARLLQLHAKRKGKVDMASFRDRAKAAESVETAEATATGGVVESEVSENESKEVSGSTGSVADGAVDSAVEKLTDVAVAGAAVTVYVPPKFAPSATRAPKAKTALIEPGSQAETIAALAVELAAADKARADVLARLRAAVA